VPVVSQAFVCPYPAGTSRLISAVWLAFPPLWPGLRTTVSPLAGGAAEETGAEVRCRCDGDERAVDGAELEAGAELETGAERDGGAERAEGEDGDRDDGVEGRGTADPVPAGEDEQAARRATVADKVSRRARGTRPPSHAAG